MRFERFDYSMMVPPIPVPPFTEMTDDEAVAHFRWFVGESQRRVQLLRDAYAWEIENAGDLDGSNESIVRLWKWLSRYAEVASSGNAAAAQARSELPEWARKAGIQNRQLSAPSLALAVDAGFYIAETLIGRYPGQVTWVLWKKTDDHFYNRPVLDIFGGHPLIPHELIINTMWGVIHGKYDDRQLLKVFDYWDKAAAITVDDEERENVS